MERSDQLQNLTDEVIECRALGHSWRADLSWGWREGDTVQKNDATEIRKCTRCGTEQLRHYSAFWEILEVKTSYAPGYLLAPGSGYGEWRKEARKELFNRRLGTRRKKRNSA